MKLYLDMLNISTIPAPWTHGTDGLMRLSGINLGNFAFRHALYSILADLADYAPVDYTTYRSHSEGEPPEHVIISCANWLGQGEAVERNNGFRADSLERAKQITVFGLGAQAPAGATELTLGPETQRMVQVMADRGASLSVRDTLTADALRKLGVEVVITGCPSNFINLNPALGSTIADKARAGQQAAPGWQDLRCFISEASGGHDQTRAVVGSQLQLMAEHGAAYVLQTPALLPLLLRESIVVPELYLQSSPWSSEDTRRVLRRAMQHFSSVDAWLDYARTCELAFGMRIHGTMIPLQAEVPSLLVQHDSRTAGLAQQMGIPATTPEDYVALQAAGPAALFARIAEGMEGYDARRQDLAQVMCAYLASHGMTPHKGLAALAA